MGKKPPRKEIGYRVFPDANRIGRPKAVTSIPILLGHYGQLHTKHKEDNVDKYRGPKIIEWTHRQSYLYSTCSVIITKKTNFYLYMVSKNS